jgi:hypothetical protein
MIALTIKNVAWWEHSPISKGSAKLYSQYGGSSGKLSYRFFFLIILSQGKKNFFKPTALCKYITPPGLVFLGDSCVYFLCLLSCSLSSVHLICSIPICFVISYFNIFHLIVFYLCLCFSHIIHPHCSFPTLPSSQLNPLTPSVPQNQYPQFPFTKEKASHGHHLKNAITTCTKCTYKPSLHVKTG